MPARLTDKLLFFLKKSSLSQYSLKRVQSEMWAVVFQRCSSVISPVHNHTVWNTLTQNTQPYCIRLHRLRTMWIFNTHTHVLPDAFLSCFFFLGESFCTILVCNIRPIQKFEFAVFKTWLVCYKYIKERGRKYTCVAFLWSTVICQSCSPDPATDVVLNRTLRKKSFRIVSLCISLFQLSNHLEQIKVSFWKSSWVESLFCLDQTLLVYENVILFHIFPPWVYPNFWHPLLLSCLDFSPTPYLP